jgi:hypothetical protein
MATKTIIDFIPRNTKHIGDIMIEYRIATGDRIRREAFQAALWQMFTEGKIDLQVHNSPYRLDAMKKANSIQRPSQHGMKYYYYAMLK